MKIYISGKITGDRRYKAKFREVEKKLAAAGHIVLNPATAPEGLRPVDYMRLCFAMMEAADVVLFIYVTCFWTKWTSFRARPRKRPTPFPWRESVQKPFSTAKSLWPPPPP